MQAAALCLALAGGASFVFSAMVNDDHYPQGTGARARSGGLALLGYALVIAAAVMAWRG